MKKAIKPTHAYKTKNFINTNVFFFKDIIYITMRFQFGI